MVLIQVELDNQENIVVELVRVKQRLLHKRAAIKYIIKEYGKSKRL